MLEDHPILRGRLLGLSAIAAILIGGAASVDFMLTSGLQFGDAASAATSASAAPQIFDDIPRDLNNPSPPARQVDVEGADGLTDSIANSDGLDGAGDGGGTPTLPAVAPVASRAPETSFEAQHAESERRFDAIEADIRQASQGDDEPSKDASETASPW